MKPYRPRSKGPTQAQRRAALRMVLTFREKPLDAQALVSLSRSYGEPVSFIERLWAEVKAA